MRITLLSLLVLFTACARTGSPARSASETLKEYYAACTSADTARTYALSTSERVKQLQSNAAYYFVRCYSAVDSIQVLRESPLSDTQTEVLYTDVRYNRTTGIREDSSLVGCTMKKEGGEWKVSLCHAPKGSAI
jgi:hypothetical protein